MKALLCLLSALCLSSAWAAERTNLEFWGFSPDGRHLAFEQYGFDDFTAEVVGRLAVVDVTGNRFVDALESVQRTDWQPDPDAAFFAPHRAALAKKLENTVRRMGIRRGLTGTLAFQAGSVTLLERGEWLPKPLPTHAAFSAGGKQYALELRLRPMASAFSCDKSLMSYPDGKTQGIELRLKVGGQSHILQRDASLPPARACVYAYGIARVYVYRSSLAVFLRTLSADAEGATVRWMVVTAKL